MSVLMEMSMFPLSGGASKSEQVAKIIGMIAKSGYAYTLTPMSTIIETESLTEALRLVEYAYACLDESERVYACLKFDIRPGRENGLEEKIQSVESTLGFSVSTCSKK